MTPAKFIACILLGAILALSAILAAPIPDRVDMEAMRVKAQELAQKEVSREGR